MNKKDLFAEALKTREQAYAPYSKFLVGAALIDDKGQVAIGCNFENSSYGATICAERNAIGAMVAHGGRKIQEIVIVTDVEKATPPCGMCRQVLSEFTDSPENMKIHVGNLKGIVKTFTLLELLPQVFDSSYLK
jgi:cytidine deaminase